jgi:tRNA(fMet)-specific endonuclease VapC
MNRTLLDTDIFSEVLKKRDQQVAVTAQQYYSRFGQYTISTITVLEIVKGLHKVKREKKIQDFLTSLAGTEILTLTEESAELAGRMYADLESRGQTIGRADPIIAAIAAKHQLVLATGNENHYTRIQNAGYDLQLTNWRTAPSSLNGNS